MYTIKREYETQTDEGRTRKFADLAPRPIEGVGPRTTQGMPVALKSVSTCQGGSQINSSANVGKKKIASPNFGDVDG